jgi:predicted nucleotidyltransferase
MALYLIGHNDTMRLTPNEQDIIKRAAWQHFNAPVRLFGSRLDDQKKGGDIDLYIESAHIGADAFERELAMTATLWAALGERKIDIVLNNGQHHLPIYERAKAEGVYL